MEQVGDGDINTSVDMGGSIANDFKDGGNSVGDDHTDIALMGDQEGRGGASAAESLVLDKISTAEEVGTASVPEEKEKKPRRKRRTTLLKKPPYAPKRFKSSFIFFSIAKRKEIKEALKEGQVLKTETANEMVSEAWRGMEPLEKEKFEEMARQDKARYVVEKRNYRPPPGLSRKSKRKKDPTKPKRPMSAYLAYANKLRGKVKAENPNATNGQISKILSKMWKAMTEDERKGYKENEQHLRGIYREKMVVWKRDNDGRKKGRRKANNLLQQISTKGSKEKDNHNIESIDFSSHVVNDTGVDEQLLGLGGVPGIDTNPNTDEILAATALRGVRGGPHQYLGFGSGDPSQNSGYNGVLGASSTNAVHHMVGGTVASGQAGFGQMEMSGFPYSQYGYPLGGNTRAMIMAQLRGTTHQHYPGFMAFDQQANLSQLASLAGVQNDIAQQQQQLQLQLLLQQSIDQSDQQATEGGLGIEMGTGNLGNSSLNENSGGNSASF